MCVDICQFYQQMLTDLRSTQFILRGVCVFVSVRKHGALDSQYQGTNQRSTLHRCYVHFNSYPSLNTGVTQTYTHASTWSRGDSVRLGGVWCSHLPNGVTPAEEVSPGSATLVSFRAVPVQGCFGGELKFFFQAKHLGAIHACLLLQFPVFPSLQNAYLLPSFRSPPDKPLQVIAHCSHHKGHWEGDIWGIGPQCRKKHRPHGYTALWLKRKRMKQ